MKLCKLVVIVTNGMLVRGNDYSMGGGWRKVVDEKSFGVNNNGSK